VLNKRQKNQKVKSRMDNIGHKTENEEWVSEGLLFNVNSAILNAMMIMSTLY